MIDIFFHKSCGRLYDATTVTFYGVCGITLLLLAKIPIPLLLLFLFSSSSIGHNLLSLLLAVRTYLILPSL